MADNFLERHREDYEQRKAAWLRRKKHLPKSRSLPFSVLMMKLYKRFYMKNPSWKFFSSWDFFISSVLFSFYFL